MRTAGYFVAIALILAFIVITSINQLSGEKTPAEMYCVQAESMGMVCTVVPDKFTAQVIVTTAMGKQSAYLIVKSEKGEIFVVPLSQ
jgi:hypothetical protein